jgi:hypothetical protein
VPSAWHRTTERDRSDDPADRFGLIGAGVAPLRILSSLAVEGPRGVSGPPTAIADFGRCYAGFVLLVASSVNAKRGPNVTTKLSFRSRVVAVMSCSPCYEMALFTAPRPRKCIDRHIPPTTQVERSMRLHQKRLLERYGTGRATTGARDV